MVSNARQFNPNDWQPIYKIIVASVFLFMFIYVLEVEDDRTFDVTIQKSLYSLL